MRILILEKGQIAAAPKWAFKRPGQVAPDRLPWAGALQYC
jgi:hypothetical protein